MATEYINSDLLRRARELNINLSQTLERHLAEVVREAAGRRWQEENRGAVKDYQKFVERPGVFGDEWRTF